jgi:hypothetical protein
MLCDLRGRRAWLRRTVLGHLDRDPRGALQPHHDRIVHGQRKPSPSGTVGATPRDGWPCATGAGGGYARITPRNATHDDGPSIEPGRPCALRCFPYRRCTGLGITSPIKNEVEWMNSSRTIEASTLRPTVCSRELISAVAEDHRQPEDRDDHEPERAIGERPRRVQPHRARLVPLPRRPRCRRPRSTSSAPRWPSLFLAPALGRYSSTR